MHETIAEAVMSQRHLFVLEGHDDTRFYGDILKDVYARIVLKPIELVDGYSEGGRQVIEFCTAVVAASDIPDASKKYATGIIDKDVLDYRGEMPRLENIIALPYYSFESYYICRAVCWEIMKICTSQPHNEISHLIDEVFDRAVSRTLDAYYPSLESLFGALNSGHKGEFGYSRGSARSIPDNVRQKLVDATTRLDAFAELMSLRRDITSLRLFAKGKWLMELFHQAIFEIMSDFSKSCQEQSATPCEYCAAGVYAKCKMKISIPINSGALAHLTYGFSEYCETSELRALLKSRLINH